MIIIKDEDTIKSLVNILENLEYYLHKYDNAIDFITLKGNNSLIFMLIFYHFPFAIAFIRYGTNKKYFCT